MWIKYNDQTMKPTKSWVHQMMKTSDRHFVGTFPHNIPVECMKMQSLGKKQTNPQTIRHMNKVLSKNYKNYISYSVPFKWNVQQLTN